MNIVGFIGASVLLTLMPGPDIIFVITQSISQGKKSGILIALGLCTGLIFHTMAASLGITLIIYKSALAFQIVKYIGAAYLIYLGIEAVITRNKSKIEFSRENNAAYKNLYKKGIFMNLLNPKVSLFFLAFLPQFVGDGEISTTVQMIFLGTIFIVQAIIIFSLVSTLADKLSERFMKNPNISKIVNLIKASVFFIIGISLAFGEK